MDVSAIVKAIDDRIALLRQVSGLLSATAVPATEKRAKAAVAAIEPATAASGRKPMSAEGRARIVAAQKKRWALRNGDSAAQEDGKATKTTTAKGATGKKTTAGAASPAKAGKASKTTKVSKTGKASAPAKKAAAKPAAVKKATVKPAAVKKAPGKKATAKTTAVKQPVEELSVVAETAPATEDTQS